MHYDFLTWLILFVAYLITLLVSHWCCYGAYIATRFDDFEVFDEDPEKWKKSGCKVHDKMILWWIRYYFSGLPEFYRKPFYLCMTCMASFWSIAPSLLYTYAMMPSMWYFFIVWPCVTLPLSGINSQVAFNIKND